MKLFIHVTFLLLCFALMITNCHCQEMQEQLAVAESNHAKGHEYMSAGKYKQAIVRFRKSVRLSPNNIGYYGCLLSVYSAQERYKKIIRHWAKLRQEGLVTNYNYAPLLLYVGTSYDGLGLPVEAIEQYKLAIEIDSNEITAYYNLGTAYSEVEQYSEAIRYLTKAILMNPSPESHLLEWSYLNRGNVRMKMKEHEAALEDINVSISIDSGNALAFCNRGSAHLNLGEYGYALADMRKSIVLDSTIVYTYNNMANVYFAMGELDMACKYWKLAISKGYVYEEKFKRIWNIDDPVRLIATHCK